MARMERRALLASLSRPAVARAKGAWPQLRRVTVVLPAVAGSAVDMVGADRGGRRGVAPRRSVSRG